jgi:tetratricopeptide (TPR) repeat protein
LGGDLKYQWLGDGSGKGLASALDVEGDLSIQTRTSMIGLAISKDWDSFDFNFGARTGYYHASKESDQSPDYISSVDIGPPKNVAINVPSGYFNDLFLGLDIRDENKRTSQRLAVICRIPEVSARTYTDIQTPQYASSPTSIVEGYTFSPIWTIEATFFFGLPAATQASEDRKPSIEFNSFNPAAHLVLGRKLMNAGYFQDANDQLELALKQAPDLAEAEKYLGICYYKLQQWHLARVHCQKAFIALPEDGELKAILEQLKVKKAE